MKKKNVFKKIFVSLLGIGYLKPASATIGSAATILIIFWFWPSLGLAQKLLTASAIFVLGVYIADSVEKQEQLHDPHFIVIDETVGVMITTLFLQQIWWHWLIAFFLFRFFDIAKFWPASIFDKKHGGFALMIDDVLMAIPAVLLLEYVILPYLS